MGVSIEKSKEMNVVNNSKTKDSKEEEKTEPGQAVEYNRCYNCQDKVNSRKRVFSKQSWEALLLWNEISPNTVEKPICDYCYQELRSILMERNDELEASV